MTQTYQVNDLYTCIQGEGVHAGTPMYLLRLNGCGVGCPWCDTKETWVSDPAQRVQTIGEALGATTRWVELLPWDIVAAIRSLPPGPKWVLITGGEPADQDLADLVYTLQKVGYMVAIETSGTASGHIGTGINWVCVSPKIDMPGGRAILPEALAEAHEIKYVIGKPEDINKLDRLLLKNDSILRPNVQICLQPLSLSAKATQLCTELVTSRGWRLSLQIHKYMGQR